MKINLLMVWTYLVAIVLIYTAGTPISSYYHKETILIVFFLSLLGIFLKSKINYRVMYIFIFSAMFVAFTQIINLDANLLTGISMLMLIGAAILLANTISKIDLIDALFNVMTVFSAISIVMWLLGILNPNFARGLPVFRGINSYYTLGYVFFYPSGTEFYDSVLRRNEGIYREMGVFANNLVWILALKLKQEQKISFIKMEIVVLALCTTFSTTGIIALVFLLPVIIRNVSRKHSAGRYVMYVMSLVVGSGFLYRCREIVFSKFIRTHGDYGSFAIRYNGTLRDLDIFLNNVFGAGITEYERLTEGTANTITYTLAVFGIGMSIVLFIGFFSCFWNKKGYLLGNLCREMAVLVVVLTQNALAFPLFFVVAIYGYIREPGKDDKKDEGCNN